MQYKNIKISDVLALFSNLSNNNSFEVLNKLKNPFVIKDQNEEIKFNQKDKFVNNKNFKIKEISEKNKNKDLLDLKYFFITLDQKINEHTRKSSIEKKNILKANKISSKLHIFFLLIDLIRNIYSHKNFDTNEIYLNNLFEANSDFFKFIIEILSDNKFSIDFLKDQNKKEFIYLLFVIPFLKKHEYKLFLKIINEIKKSKDYLKNDIPEDFYSILFNKEKILFKFEKKDKNKIDFQDKKIHLLLNLINNFYKINSVEKFKDDKKWKKHQIYYTFYCLLELTFSGDKEYKVINMYKNNLNNLTNFFGEKDKNIKKWKNLNQKYLNELKSLIIKKNDLKDKKDWSNLEKKILKIKDKQQEINKNLKLIQFKTNDFYLINKDLKQFQKKKNIIYPKRYIAILKKDNNEIKLINSNKILKFLDWEKNINKENVIKFFFDDRKNMGKKNFEYKEYDLIKCYKNNYDSPNLTEKQLLKFIFKVLSFSKKYKLKNLKSLKNDQNKNTLKNDDLKNELKNNYWLLIKCIKENNFDQFIEIIKEWFIRKKENLNDLNREDKFIQKILDLKNEYLNFNRPNFKNLIQKEIKKYLRSKKSKMIDKMLEKVKNSKHKKGIKITIDSSYKSNKSKLKKEYDLNKIFKNLFNFYKNEIKDKKMLDKNSKEDYQRNINIINNTKENNIFDFESSWNKEIIDFYKNEFDSIHQYVGNKIITSKNKWINSRFNPHEYKTHTYKSMEKFCENKNKKEDLHKFLTNFKEYAIFFISLFRKDLIDKFEEVKIQNNKLREIRNGVIHLDPKKLIDYVENFESDWYLKLIKKFEKELNLK